MQFSLATTALEDSWAPPPEPIVFLGEWCRLHSRKNYWQDRVHVIAPYHWDDRQKLARDCRQLDDVFERFLAALSASLAHFHAEDHDERFWRIFLGPWLLSFLHTIFDRWESIRLAISRYSIASSILINAPPDTLIPRDLEDYYERFCFSDRWNHSIYSEALRDLGRDIEFIPKQEGGSAQMQTVAGGSDPGASISPGRILLKLMQRLSGEKSYFVYGSYLGSRREMELQWRLQGLPALWSRPSYSAPPPQMQVREWRLSIDPRGEFERFAARLVPLQIPTAYLEGFAALRDAVRRSGWPRRPKAIFTSCSYEGDEAFKYYTGAAVERGAKLAIGQHGGLYGTAHRSSTEEHEKRICDRYLTWGWTEGANSKVRPVGMIKKAERIMPDPNARDRLLLIGCAMGRYSFRLDSAFIGPQWLQYFDDQIRFANALPERLRAKLLVRLYPRDFGWDQHGRWKENASWAEISESSHGLTDQISAAKLSVATYNATTFLESFALQKPTLMFWNTSHWELRKEAKEYFDRLEAVGVFHSDPETAARFVERSWDQLDRWWADPETQSAVQCFVRRFADDRAGLTKRLARELRILPDDRKLREPARSSSKND